MGLKKRSHVNPEFNLASMIDVIFLLLLFFMLSSKLVSTNALNLQLPSSSSKTSTPPDFVEVSIKQNGETYIGTELMLNDMKLIKTKLIGAVEKARSGAERPEDVTVALNAEKDATIDQVARIMGIANELQVKMILNTQEPTE